MVKADCGLHLFPARLGTGWTNSENRKRKSPPPVVESEYHPLSLSIGLQQPSQQVEVKKEVIVTNSSPPSGAQLTIFYAGSVHVFDNVTPDKVQALNLLVAESCSMKKRGNLLISSIKAEPFIVPPQPPAVPAFRTAQSVLPHSRKISLARFLAKRKERIRLRAAAAISSSKEEEENKRNLQYMRMKTMMADSLK